MPERVSVSSQGKRTTGPAFACEMGPISHVTEEGPVERKSIEVCNPREEARALEQEIVPVLLYRRGGTVQALFLETPWITVGSAAGVTIEIAGPRVSPRHALFRCSGSRVEVHDFGSRHGILHNGQPVPWARLHRGDRVEVGGHEFIFLEIEFSRRGVPG